MGRDSADLADVVRCVGSGAGASHPYRRQLAHRHGGVSDLPTRRSRDPAAPLP